MSILDSILEYYPEDEILKADGFDDAILGYDESSGRLIYSVQKNMQTTPVEYCVDLWDHRAQ